MTVTFVAICVVILIMTALVSYIRDRRDLELHTITPQALYALLSSDRDVVVLDVRQPLDLLGDSVIIAGAKWFAPAELVEDPSLMPWASHVVVYCTCPTDKSSRAVLHRALAMGFSRIKFLKGGLDGWRALGYPVEPYEKPFRLNLDQNTRLRFAS